MPFSWQFGEENQLQGKYFIQTGGVSTAVTIFNDY
jgi:hypothetical protein